MDYLRPIEAVIPGARGRVLEVLARTDAELTIRAVAELGGVSANRATGVMAELVGLGLVSRRDVGRAALVRLNRDNEAARFVLQLAELRDEVLERLRSTACAIRPAPASLVVFGSFARGEARADSDLDVVAVRSAEVAPDNDAWTDSLGAWQSLAGSIAGNPVNLIEIGAEEVTTLLRRRGDTVWKAIQAQGIVLLGSGLRELGRVA